MKGKNQPVAKDKAEKKPYEKPRIILEDKIEGRAAVCSASGGKALGHIPPCGFVYS